jgi:hypothetical protein
LIIISYFVNDILSSLVSKQVERIETIEQLTHENDIKILVVKNSQTHHFLKQVKKYIYKIIEFILLRKYFQGYTTITPRLHQIDFLEEFKFDLIIKLVSREYVFIGGMHRIRNLMEFYHQYNLIATGDENFKFYYFGFVTRKTWKSSLKKNVVKM